MAQVNTCLKRTFTIFNVFFAIIGGIIITLTLALQILSSSNGGSNVEGRFSSLIILYIIGAVTMVIAVVGAYGAHKESRAAMIVFLVCMVIGSLLMLRLGVPAAALRPELEDILEDRFRHLLPLDKATDEVKNMANAVQEQLHCCGLFSYEDWEGNFPESCLCDAVEEEEGLCRSTDYLTLLRQASVYQQPCLPIIMYYILLAVDVLIGVALALAVLALLGMILSSVIIHQMRQRSRPTLLLTVPAIFTPQPPKYQELHNPPGY